MDTIERAVSSALSAEAETITMAPHLRDGIVQRARRYRARRAATIAVATFAVLAAAVAGPLMARDRSHPTDRIPPAAAPAQLPNYESWHPRGDLAGDTAFIQAAVQAWAVDERDPEPRTHTDVNTVWAGRLPTGRAAVLTGTDPSGMRRLAVIGGAGRQLFTMRDLRAPQSLSQLSFNLFTEAESRSSASYRDTLVVVLPPGSTNRVRWFNGLTNGSPAGPDLAATDGIAVIDISTAGPAGRPNIQILDGDNQLVYDGPIGSMS